MQISRLPRGILIFTFLTAVCLPACDQVKKLQIKSAVDLKVTVDRSAGHYHPLPTALNFTFPSSVNMTTVISGIFSVTGTCGSADVGISSVSVAGNTATVTLSGTSSCTDGQSFIVAAQYQNVGLTDDGSYATGGSSLQYVYDSTGPRASASINALSGITPGIQLTFSSIPANVTYAFSSDTDFSTISTANFVISPPYSGAPCTTPPSIGTLTKDSTASTVTVPISGGTCGNAQGFKITLSANSVSDKTMNGSTGAAAANMGPMSSYPIGILIDTSTPPQITSIGSGATTGNGLFGIGQSVNIAIGFDSNVDVTGTPRLRVNATGIATRYANYVSGSGTNNLIFSYTVQSGDVATLLDSASTSALQLNGGTIFKSFTAISANLTLPAPGAAGSLGNNRSIAIDGIPPTFVSSNPASSFSWGTQSRSVSFTMSEAVAAGSISNSTLTVVAGTCLAVPVVTSASVGGVGNAIVTFQLSNNSCGSGQNYVLAMNPTSLTDLAGNSGTGNTQSLTITTDTTAPTLTIGAPSVNYVNSSGSSAYTVSYSGASAVTLAVGDIGFSGTSAGCAATITGTGTATRTVTITGCTSDGAVKIDIAGGTAKNSIGNLAPAIPETAITDFYADNTPLPDPTTDLPLLNASAIYALDNQSSFNLNFAGDNLGLAGAISSSLSLSCNSGSGSNPVSFIGTRTSATSFQIAPNQSSTDFVYGSACAILGTNVPDAAGNLHTFSALPFNLTTTPVAVSGLPTSISIATANAAGSLGSVVFSIPMNPATLSSTNVSLMCAGKPIALVATLPASSGNTTYLTSFITSDANWTSLTGGESCQVTFGTSVTNSLGQALASAQNYTFTTTP